MGSSCCSCRSARVVDSHVFHRTIHHYQYEHHDRSFVSWLYQQRNFYNMSESVFQQILRSYYRGGYIPQDRWQGWYEGQMKYHMDLELKQLQANYEVQLRQAERREERLAEVISSYRNKQRQVYVRYLIKEDERKQLVQSHNETHIHNHTTHPVVVQPQYTVQLHTMREREQDYVNWLWHQHEAGYITRTKVYTRIQSHMTGRSSHTHTQHRTTATQRRHYRMSTEKHNQLGYVRDHLDEDLSRERVSGLTRSELQIMLQEYRRRQIGVIRGSYNPHGNQQPPDDPEYQFVYKLVHEDDEDDQTEQARRLRLYLEEHWRENHQHNFRDTDSEIQQWVHAFGQNIQEKVEKHEEKLSEEDLVALLKLYKARMEKKARKHRKKERCLDNVIDGDKKFINNLSPSDLQDEEEIAKKVRRRLRRKKRLQGIEDNNDDNEDDGENMTDDEDDNDEMKVLAEAAENEVKEQEGEWSQSELLALLEKYRRQQMKLISNKGKYTGSDADDAKSDDEDDDDDSEPVDDAAFVDKISAIDLQDLELIAKLLRNRFVETNKHEYESNSIKEKKMNELGDELEREMTADMTKEQLLALLLRYRGRERQVLQEDHSTEVNFDDDNEFINNLPDDKIDDADFIRERLVERLGKLDVILEKEETPSEHSDVESFVESDSEESDEEEAVEEPHQDVLSEEMPDLEELMNDPEYKGKVEAINDEYEQRLNEEGNTLSKEQLLELLMDQRQRLAELVAEKKNKEAQTGMEEEITEEQEIKDALERKRRGSISEDEFNDLMKQHLHDVDALKDHKGKEKDRLNDKLRERLAQHNKSKPDENDDSEENSDVDESANGEELKELDNKFDKELNKKVREEVSESAVQDLLANHKKNRENLIQLAKEKKEKANEKMKARLQKNKVAPKPETAAEKETKMKEAAAAAMVQNKEDEAQLMKRREQDKNKHQEGVKKKLQKKKAEKKPALGQSVYGAASVEDQIQALLQSQGKVDKLKGIFASPEGVAELTQFLNQHPAPGTSSQKKEEINGDVTPKEVPIGPTELVGNDEEY